MIELIVAIMIWQIFFCFAFKFGGLIRWSLNALAPITYASTKYKNLSKQLKL